MLAQAEVVSLHDIGVDHASDGAGFGGETALEIILLRQAGQDEFDRNIAAQIGVARAIHLCHGAAAKQFDHFVSSNGLAY